MFNTILTLVIIIFYMLIIMTFKNEHPDNTVQMLNIFVPIALVLLIVMPDYRIDPVWWGFISIKANVFIATPASALLVLINTNEKVNKLLKGNVRRLLYFPVIYILSAIIVSAITIAV